MPGAHGAHELIELTAAILLSVGGGLILVRAGLSRRTIRTASVALQPSRSGTAGSGTAGSGTAGGTASSAVAVQSTTAVVRRVATLVAAGLSMAAAAIHLAAGPGHVEVLGDIGLGFYWAALFQAGFAAALLARPRSGNLARVGIAMNLALIGAWGWSRLVGLPSMPGGPESIGVADATVVVFQSVLVGLLVARLRGLGRRVGAIRSGDTVRSVATAGLVTVAGVIFLSTTIAIADAVGGHDHGSDAGHGHPLSEPASVSDATEPT